MKTNSIICLDILSKHPKLYGQQIIELTGITKGSLYTTLTRLEIQGLVETWAEKRVKTAPGFLRFAKITPNGKIYLKGKLLTERATAGGK